MNLLQILDSQPWVERLGWTLIHFLWQGAVIAALYAAARRALRGSGPSARYILGCAALAAMVLAPVVTWRLMRPLDSEPAPASRALAIRPAATVVAATLPVSVREAVPGAWSGQFLPWVVGIWFLGVSLLWIRLIGGWVIAARMRSMLVRPAPPEWRQAFRELGARIGVFRPVRLLVSALVQAPIVVGWLRPVVLVPVGALSGLPSEQVEALLIHELAHIRRHDYLINILQSVAEALLFYHPAVWWVSSHIRTERELCCDDVAVAVSGDALLYVRALVQLESFRPAHVGAAVAANGGSLSARIARLLGQSRPAARSGLGQGIPAAAILLVAAALGLFGQSDAHPAFEVASIKQHPEEAGERYQHPVGVGYRAGGRMIAQDASLMLLIRFAYAPHDSPHSLPLLASQVAGGPPWADTFGYDIEAKPAGNTDPKHSWLMLQTLLADRFKLKLHREIRELPVYDLTVAKNGPKLPAAKEAGCVSFPPGAPPRQVPGKVDCGYVSGPFGFGGGQLHIQGRKVHMADLIRELASVLDRPVLDKTGFTGEFDLDLTFAPDETLAGFPSHQPTADPNLPNILAALQEQLGLKLVPSKGPVEVLVIDHADRPTAN